MLRGPPAYDLLSSHAVLRAVGFFPGKMWTATLTTPLGLVGQRSALPVPLPNKCVVRHRLLPVCPNGGQKGNAGLPFEKGVEALFPKPKVVVLVIPKPGNREVGRAFPGVTDPAGQSGVTAHLAAIAKAFPIGHLGLHVLVGQPAHAFGAVAV